jgi:signal peptidase II
MTHEASSPPETSGAPHAAPIEPSEGPANLVDAASLEPSPRGANLGTAEPPVGTAGTSGTSGTSDTAATPDTAGPKEDARRADEDEEPDSAPTCEVTPPRPNYVFLAGVALVSLAADLGTKIWAKGRLEEGPSRRIEVISKYMALIFAKNRGGAWGLLGDQPESVRRPFFFCVSALAIVFIVSLYRRLTPQQTALKWGLPLVLGGALGNLVNRIQYNFVVDFIDVYATWGDRTHHWPTFNVADIAISVGVGLMAIDMFTTRRPA